MNKPPICTTIMSSLLLLAVSLPSQADRRVNPWEMQDELGYPRYEQNVRPWGQMPPKKREQKESSNNNPSYYQSYPPYMPYYSYPTPQTGGYGANPYSGFGYFDPYSPYSGGFPYSSPGLRHDWLPGVYPGWGW